MIINTKYIWTDEARMGGTPCIRNHRFPLTSLFTYLLCLSKQEICNEYNLTLEEINGVLIDLAELT